MMSALLNPSYRRRRWCHLHLRAAVLDAPFKMELDKEGMIVALIRLVEHKLVRCTANVLAEH